MKLLFYRIYYTIYKGLIWLGQNHETDMIRVNAVFIQTLFTMFIAVGVVGFLITITGKSIIVNSTFQSVIMLLMIADTNGYMVFYKKKYIKFEDDLSLTWIEMKSKNIILTLLFIVGSIVFFCISIVFIKAHPLTK